MFTLYRKIEEACDTKHQPTEKGLLSLQSSSSTPLLTVEQFHSSPYSRAVPLLSLQSSSSTPLLYSIYSLRLVPEEARDGSGSLVVKVRLKSYITHADVATDKEICL